MPMYFVLGIVCLFFSLQLQATPIADHHVIKDACSVKPEIAKEWTENADWRITSHRPAEDNKGHIAHRKRGISSYYINRSANFSSSTGSGNGFFVVAKIKSKRQFLQRPFYYIHLFRYALF
jgi:hypothetical protein